MSEVMDFSQPVEETENNTAGTKPENNNTENKKNNKPVLMAIVIIVVILSIGTVVYLNYQKSHFVKTENAAVQRNMITVASKMSGTVVDVKVKQGDYVKKGDILMEVNPLVTDANSVDNSFVRSTIDGTVLKTLNTEGQSITAGQTVCYIANDEEVFVTANIDEKDINEIQIGQDVDVVIDQFGKETFRGRVIEVGSATNSAFSIVPSSASGTFVKSTQLAPVKIKFEENIDNVLVGANATVSIHLK